MININDPDCGWEFDPEELLQGTIDNNAEIGVWQCKDGTKVKFEEMGTNHARNIINYFRGRNITLPSCLYAIANRGGA